MWSLSPDVRHLNHGSFGAVPTVIQEAQAEWRSRWEANPTRFVYRDLPERLEESREALAGFTGASVDGMVFVRNASQGIAAVVRSLEPKLGPGDEVLTTDHEYNAVRQILEYAGTRSGARVRVVQVPFPIETSRAVTDRVMSGVTECTRLVVIDHVTSPTGLVFPVDEIVAALEPETPVLVDGAHGPGQVSIDLTAMGASWYAGNLHKWMCAPKGAGFLSTRADRIDETVPTVISHAWNTVPSGHGRHRALFDWTGTDDFSPWLVVPDVISVVGDLETGGWPALMKRNHELALAARHLVCRELEIPVPAPDDMIGSMFGVPMGHAEGADRGDLISPLMRSLLTDGYETAVSVWPRWPGQVLRLSAHHYNRLEEYAELAAHLKRVVGTATRPPLG